ncbi:MAG: hypothetical protein MUP27_14650 [Desulfobacterales bacterium]|nr:hypothetical protein [Desulfobacterales bacterium]
MNRYTLLGKSSLKGVELLIPFYEWNVQSLPCEDRSFIDSVSISRRVVEQLI